MNSLQLPIIGAGSQPQERDGVELNFMSMPSQINTYAKPYISSHNNLPALANAKLLLTQLFHAFAEPSFIHKQFATDSLNLDELRLINEILGEGEVSIMIKNELTCHIQESVLAGIWRIKQYNRNNDCIADYIEIADIPKIIKHNTFNHAVSEITFDKNNLPEGLMNALPLIAELNEHIKQYAPDKPAHIINLSLLPQTEQDLLFLQNLLGAGCVTILSRSYGTNRITSTNTDKVWWVHYFNSDDVLILNTLEVSQVPLVACAALDDLADSKQRLQEILEHDLAE